MLIFQATGKNIHPTRYCMPIKRGRSTTLDVEKQKIVSLKLEIRFERHSSALPEAADVWGKWPSKEALATMRNKRHLLRYVS